MRLALLLVPLLLIGCISLGERGTNATNGTDVTPPPPEPNATTNETNQTGTQNQTNQTAPPPSYWERYDAGQFSFEYARNMETQESGSPGGYGVFAGTHDLDGQTGELLIVAYVNTSAAFGREDEIFQDNPTKAASDLLLSDRKSDGNMGGLLSKAQEAGNVSTFSVARDGAVAEMPFRISFGDNSSKTYTGYALSIYVPERSLHVKVRIIALDPGKARELRDNFLLSFRIE
ncbi:MAG: hypothetical protein AB1529_02150 [Candidatus Micrarchaeota archaeon]